MQEPLPAGGFVRKLWFGETAAYRDHLLRLDPDSRQRRFSGGVSDDFIARHAQTIDEVGVVVHGFFIDGVLRGAAELRPLGGPFAHQAEAAFSVERPWQSHGVGSVLLERTLLSARNRGITGLHMNCMPENRRMQQLARKFAAELSFDPDNVVGEVETPRLTPISVIREVVADAHSFATALLQTQSRKLKTA